MGDAAPQLSSLELGAAAALILVPMYVSNRLGIGLEGRMLLAAFRAGAQLCFLGFVLLQPLFLADNLLPVAGYLLFMMCLAAAEAASRSVYNYRGLFRDALLSILGGVVSVLAFSLCAVYNSASPWWDPKFLIPIAGMLLGNSISATTLGLDRVLTEMAEQTAVVELRLALGASLLEALLPSVRVAFSAGLTPNLNQMSVVGLISTPGMMTGSLLGGQTPSAAATYQLSILYLLLVTACGCLGLSTTLAIRAVSDARAHRLHPHRLRKRLGPKVDILTNLIVSACNCLRRKSCRGAEPESGTADGLHSSVATLTRLASRGAKAASRGLVATAPTARAGTTLGEGQDTHAGSGLWPAVALALSSAASRARGALGAATTPLLAGDEAGRAAESGLEEAETPLRSPSLTLDNLTVARPLSHGRRWPAGQDEESLVHLPFRVEMGAGEVLAITGRSGSGKSRLLRAVSSLDGLGSGSVALGVGGRTLEVTAMWAPRWRCKVCFVPQNVPPLKGTPEKLLAEAAGFRARRGPGCRPLEALRARFDSTAGAIGVPADVASRPWSDLSGGERHRAALALALALNPAVLLLDEPTASSDANTTSVVEAVVRNACDEEGLIVVWVTHDPAQAERVGQWHLHIDTVDTLRAPTHPGS